MTEEFSWLAFFEELFDKICTTSNPEKLYNIWNKFFPDKYSSVDNDDNVPLNKIDPLSFLGKIISHGDEELTKKCTELKNIFNLNSSIPTNYNGIPRLNRTNCLFLKEYWKNRKNKNDLEYLDYVIGTLWDFAKDLNSKTNLTENLQIKNMEKILNFHKVGISKLAQIIFLVKPQIYYSCDNKSLSYLNIEVTDNKDCNEFIEIQNIGKKTGKKPFELSYLAELYSNKRKKFFKYLKPIESKLSSYDNFINKQIYNENIEREIYKLTSMRIYDIETELSLNSTLSILNKNEEWKKYNKKHGNGIPNAILNTHYRNYLKEIDINVEDSIPTWLLSWNPDKWNWLTFEDDIQKIKNGIAVEKKYSCVSKQPKIGDRAFLIKLGKKEPKGIIASGYLSSESFTDIAEHRNDNKEVNNVIIKFDKILNFNKGDILLQSKLKELFPNQEWSTQSSGISIKEEYLTELENLWKQYGNKTKGEVTMFDNIPLNQILYGPPGTGKTYGTAKLALQIIEPNFVSEDRNEILYKYNEYKKSKQIQFITFHQSYSYEEFVEGIRPVISDKYDTIIYEPHDGIFKNIVDLAKSEYTKAQIQENIDFSKINVYKMSLGNTSDKNEYNIYDYCIENNCIGLGYGENVDFSSANTREDILKIYNENDIFKDKSQFTVDAVDRFKNWMQKGDLVLISNGNNSIRAIGLITGDYRYDNVAEIKYCQYRDVKWLYFGDDIPKDKFIFKNLSQMSIYQFYKQDLNIEFIQNMLNTDEKKNVKKYVLIIDEINRGDISDIFGELITLLEDTKRTDKENAEVTLPYSNKPFSIPPNLYIIGTMNTADRSIALLDIALRRRFDFISKYPDSSVIGQDGAKTEVEGIDLKLFLDKMNERIEVLFDKDHTIGHSYLMGINNYDDFVYKFKNRILPLLLEYFYNDYDKIAEVLNQDNIDDDEWSYDTKQIILKRLINDRPLYKINEKYPIDAFKKVCE